MPLIEFRAVTKTFAGDEGPGRTVLDAVDLAVEAGESLAIVGPSGAGKSTALNLMGGLDAPSAGSVLFDGRDLASLGEAERCALRNQRVGFVFQDHHLLPQCTVAENVLLPTLPAGRAGDASAAARAEELLARVGLGGRGRDWPSRLSGGERQRVAVVRALINRPALLLADEPTGALDQRSASALGDLLTELNREQGATLVLVTHQLELARRCQRVVELRDGRFAPL